MCEKAQEELMALAEKYQDQQKEVIEIQEKLQVITALINLLEGRKILWNTSDTLIVLVICI